MGKSVFVGGNSLISHRVEGISGGTDRRLIEKPLRGPGEWEPRLRVQVCRDRGRDGTVAGLMEFSNSHYI